MKEFFESTRPGGQFLSLWLIFIIFFIIASGCTVAVMYMGADINSPALNDVSQIIMFALSAIVFAMLFCGKPFASLGVVSTRRIVPKLLLALALLVSMTPFVDWLTQVNDAWHLPSRFSALEEQLRMYGEQSQKLVEKYLLRDGAGAFVSNVVSLALVPAVCEELFFRGALQQTLCRMLRSHHAAVLVTAAIFSLLHGEVFAFLPRFVLGAVLGYLFYYGGSIWINMFAHFCNNLTVVVLYRLAHVGVIEMEQAESFGLPWYVVVLGLVVAVFVFCQFVALGKKESPKSDN